MAYLETFEVKRAERFLFLSYRANNHNPKRKRGGSSNRSGSSLTLRVVIGK